MQLPRQLKAENLALHYRLLEAVYLSTNKHGRLNTLGKKKQTTLHLRFILIGELSVAPENSNLCYTLDQDPSIHQNIEIKLQVARK